MGRKSHTNLVGKVLFDTNWGRMTRTTFALIVRQSPKCVFIAILPQVETGKSPQMWLAGTTVPDLTKINEYFDLSAKELTRARTDWKTNGSLEYVVWKDHLFKLWDGEPKPYDYMD